MTNVKHQLVVLGLFSFLAQKVRCFQLTNLTVPPLQDPRKDMVMLCQFDLGGEDLYAVKWYKDDHEFFRYTPSIKSLYTIFPVDGVYVDTKRSRCDTGRCDLVLFNLTRYSSSGAYRCEVSSEAPTFRLASKTQNVTVAVIPQEYPVIKSLQNSYYINDILYATCTSGAGDPRPSLSFFLNRQPMPAGSKNLHQNDGLEEQDTTKRIKLQKTTIQLRTILDKKLLGNDTSLEIVCVCSVEGINQKLYTPLATTKNVVVLDPHQNVKNQKFYWPTSSAEILVSMSTFRFSVLICTVCFLIRHSLGVHFRY